MATVLGIDLGTTNSLVAVMDGDAPKMICDASGEAKLCSVVSFSDETLVGKAAKDLLITHPASTIFSVKRFMGKGMEDLSGELKRIPFQLRGNEKEALRIVVGDKSYSPPEVSAVILRALKARAEAALGESIDQAVITVPAYFNDAQRQATKDAGRMAGLDVLRILNEPTAASLAYGLQTQKKGIIAVYDLGGGTFDISILKIKNGIFEVLSTNGDTHLGGDDFDHVIMDLLHEKVLKAHDIDLFASPATLQSLRLCSEQAKCVLSSETETLLSIPLPGSAEPYEYRLTRDEFERQIADLLKRTLEACRAALTDAKLTATDVDEVVLVGGSTRIPCVRESVGDLFQRQAHSELDPDQVVALGAAVQANILSGGTTEILLLDVTPLSLGIETMGGVVSKLIHRNATIPCTANESFTTYVDGQQAVSIHVVQGERELVEDCRSLAKFSLKDIPPMPAGMARIEVTFLIDANGILSVTAKETRSGEATSVEVKPTYGLSDDDAEKMITASMENAASDIEKRQLIDAKTEADIVLRYVEKALSQGASLLDNEERQKIEAARDALKSAMGQSDRNEIKQKLSVLDEATQDLAEALMSESVKTVLKDKKLSDV